MTQMHIKLGWAAASLAAMLAVACGDSNDSLVANAADAASSADQKASLDGNLSGGDAANGSDAVAGADGSADGAAGFCATAVCDDKNACTDDKCDDAAGKCVNTNNTAACDDGDGCTASDACADGKCTGKAADCDDKNACTSDSCDKAKGCVHAAVDATPCDDGDGCTVNDTCNAGKCGSGAPNTCDDKNPCTDDTCEIGKGCSHANNAAPCSDGSLCTAADACQDGKCAAGSAIACDDKNPCTDDKCDPLSGNCAFTPNAAACDDGNACTSGDACAAGACGGKPSCACIDASDCDDKNPCTVDSCDAGKCGYANALAKDATCTDGNACTDGDACADGKCAAGKAVACDDSNPCTDDPCLPASGCAHNNNSAACDDKNTCTSGDVCAAGTCAGAPSCACKADGDCDDKNPCTQDACVSGSCVNMAAAGGAGCDDGNGCTFGDKCQGGVCLPGALTNCDDGNACTDDSCDPSKNGGCKHANNSAPCSDNDVCSQGDICAAGACKPGQPKSCDDKNPCTNDSCDPKTGCASANNTANCDDGDACTTSDSCKDGKCTVSVPVVCDDKNVCTTDSCDKAKGCVTANVAQGTVCADAACAGLSHSDPGTCFAGACLPGQKQNCDDGNPCTDDVCDPKAGCSKKTGTATCDDGNLCTIADKCTNGACIPGAVTPCDDGNGCTADSCDPTTGCAHSNTTAACDDKNACTSGDACTGGSCVGNAQVTCDDKNICTADSCDPAKGCVFTNNTAACDDQNACTSGDLCGGGKCAGAGKTDCDDKNACTDDSCDVVSGCQHVNNTGKCDDGNACTTQDACAGGLCVGGAPPVCDDNNLCTTDSCDKAKGCLHANNSNACDDGDACLGPDTCTGGACKAAGPVNCDDKNPCTDDSCNSVKGCQYANNTKACDDGNNCTNSDVCNAGKCAGVGKTCDDGNGCTKDSCDAGGGCLHTTLADGAACTDITCTGTVYQGAAICSKGVCGALPKSLDCGDGNVCTTDNCSTANGCFYTANTAGCDDGNACTSGDKCAGTKCSSGAATVCFDNNPCTDDSCDPAKGCVFANNTAACSDNNACTLNDVCAAGKCAGPLALDCNDKDPCTSDSCDPVKGCVYVFGTAKCDDGNACTDPDACDGKGNCVGGAAVACDDKNVCTTDSCDPAKGCVFTANTNPCDDGDACTTKDTCAVGKCVGGKAPNCDDKNDCTADSCDKAKGCVNANVTDGTVCGTGKCATLVLTPAPTCQVGKCTQGPDVDCNDKLECTVDACDAAKGCVNANKPFGTACTTAAAEQTQPFCAGSVCTGVEVTVYQASPGSKNGILTGIDRHAAGKLHASGVDLSLQTAVAPIQGIMTQIVEQPLGVQLNSAANKRSAMLDTRGRLAVGGNENTLYQLTNATTMVFNSQTGTWINGGPGNLQVNHPLRSVDAILGNNGAHTYYMVGDAETNSDNQPAFGMAGYDSVGNVWGNFQPIQVTTSKTTCNNTFLPVNLYDVYAASNTAVYAVGFTNPNGNGTQNSVVAFWDGSVKLNCGDLGSINTAVANTAAYPQTLSVTNNLNANPPVGQFYAVHGSSDKHLLVGGLWGTIFSYDAGKWTQETPNYAGMPEKWSANFAVRGIWTTDTDAWLTGVHGFQASVGNCRDVFVLHGSFAGGKWAWDKLLLFPNTVATCGANLDFTNSLRSYLDAQTGAVYFVGSQGADAQNKPVVNGAVNQAELVMRVKTK